LRSNRADVKVMQELLRHASSRVTLETYIITEGSDVGTIRKVCPTPPARFTTRRGKSAAMRSGRPSRTNSAANRPSPTLLACAFSLP
jgi:hypothetical protein